MVLCAQNGCHISSRCLLADFGEENSSNPNVWKQRFEFYQSAQPKNEEEEDRMMRRAIQESQKLEEERQKHMLDETASRVRLLYAFLFRNTFTCSSVLVLVKGIKC